MSEFGEITGSCSYGIATSSIGNSNTRRGRVGNSRATTKHGNIEKSLERRWVQAEIVFNNLDVDEVVDKWEVQVHDIHKGNGHGHPTHVLSLGFVGNKHLKRAM